MKRKFVMDERKQIPKGKIKLQPKRKNRKRRKQETFKKSLAGTGNNAQIMD